MMNILLKKLPGFIGMLAIAMQLLAASTVFAQQDFTQTDKRVPWKQAAVNTALPQETNELIDESQIIQGPIVIKPAEKIKPQAKNIELKESLFLEAMPQITETPGDKELFKQARDRLDKKQYQSAIYHFELIFELYPKSKYISDSCFWLAEANYFLGNHAEAIEKYKKLLLEYPKNKHVIHAELRLSHLTGIDN